MTFFFSHSVFSVADSIRLEKLRVPVIVCDSHGMTLRRPRRSRPPRSEAERVPALDLALALRGVVLARRTRPHLQDVHHFLHDRLRLLCAALEVVMTVLVADHPVDQPQRAPPCTRPADG